MLLVIKGRLGGHRFKGLEGREGRADLPYTGHGLTYERVVSGESTEREEREDAQIGNGTSLQLLLGLQEDKKRDVYYLA